MTRTLLWFRGKDLRLADHAPLRSALESGEVVPLFVLDPYFFAPARARELPHRMQFLLEALASLSQNVARLGSQLLLAEGKSVDVVPELARRFKVTRVVAQRWSEPFARELQVRALRAGRIAVNGDSSPRVELALGELSKPLAHGRGQTRARRIETQHDLRRDLVDVLPAGPARAYRGPLELGPRYAETVADSQIVHLSPAAAGLSHLSVRPILAS